MDITPLAAWGEFIGGIAVVVSLVYLAGQIRQNTKTARVSNFGDMLLASDQYNAAISDPETASLYLRGLADLEAAQVLLVRLIRRTAEKAGEVPHRTDVIRLSLRREAADLHVLDHALA